jgi:hypothetical protein
MLDANAKPADRQIAAGTFLILLGIVFLLSSLVSGVVNAFIPVRA